jgi:hypothetical protein
MTNANGNGSILPTIPSPFDPASLRLSQDFVAMANVKKELSTVRFKRPAKQVWFRVHPDPEFRLSPLATIHLKDDDTEWYVVAPALVGSLQNELTYVSLFTVVDRHGNVSLWPVPLPPADGKDNDWWKSARDAAERAMTTWTRMIANKQLGAYDIGTTGDAGAGVPSGQSARRSAQSCAGLGLSGR